MQMSENENRRQGILLETGTNEVEIIEFFLSDQSFGVNVAKVKQIVQFDEGLLTHIPQSHPAMAGYYLFRENTIPMIDLKKALEFPEGEPPSKPLALVTEFNEHLNAFLIDRVNRIHRVSWSDLEPMNPLLEGGGSCFTGSINIGKCEILIVDLERLVAEISSKSQMDTETAKLIDEAQNIKVILAEDSTYIRNSMIKNLKSLGFSVLEAFDNGQDAYEFMKMLKDKADQDGKSVRDYLDIVITDIEMPRLDGLTLCKNIKEELGIKNLPVVVFSSLINAQMEKKCQTVGVDRYTSKPKLEELKDIILSCCSQNK